MSDTNSVQPTTPTHQLASQEVVDEAKRRTLEIINVAQWEVLMKVATAFWKAGALPQCFKNEYQVLMALQAGAEIGLQPITSMNSFYFVNGKVALYGESAIALVQKAGYTIEWGVCNAEEATVTLSKDGKSNTTTVKMSDMKARGLTGKDVWVKYPENMLRFKAFHLNARFFASGALHNLMIAELEEQDDAMAKIASIPDHSTRKAVESITMIDAAEKPHTSLTEALEADLGEKKEEEEKPELPKPNKGDSAAVRRMKEAAAKAQEKQTED